MVHDRERYLRSQEGRETARARARHSYLLCKAKRTMPGLVELAFFSDSMVLLTMMQEKTKARLRESRLLATSGREGEFKQPSLRLSLHICTSIC